jgi:adenosylhomocysteine nucleosidase
MMSASPDKASTRRVAILAPMPSELGPLVKLLGLVASNEAMQTVWHGAVGTTEIVAGRTGIGMRKGAAAAERFLEQASPDHLFVVGIAGGIGPDAHVGAVIDPVRVRNLETGEEIGPTRMGTTEGHGVLVSSDRLLDANEARSFASEGVIAVDMETAAIGSVCERAGCPWSVYRAISDRADDGTTDAAVLGLVDAEGRPKPGAVAGFLLTRPHRLFQLIHLARGTNRATARAARAAVAALHTL